MSKGVWELQKGRVFLCAADINFNLYFGRILSLAVELLCAWNHLRCKRNATCNPKICLQSETLVLSSQETYFSYSSFPSHKYLFYPVSSIKVGIKLACWFVDFDSKLGSSGQFNFKKFKYLRVFHRKLRVFWTPDSPAFSAVAVFAHTVALLHNALSLRGLRCASPAAFIPSFLHSLIALFLYCSIPSFLPSFLHSLFSCGSLEGGSTQRQACLRCRMPSVRQRSVCFVRMSSS